uniref:Fatty acyl-CoA reductase n=1 Tax=Kalanchoe fedtschenkoi TaxID=63787 RepID=A0A7N0TVA3_KALFE
MEPLSSIVGFLENKTILVTGSTGFVAKVFVEKILRIQPKVKKLFLLLRAKDSTSASTRLYKEILSKELFVVLKEKWGSSDLSNLISERVTVPVGGDISSKDLGVKEVDLKNEMWNEVDVVVNLAATVNFDERYDVALAINTMGPKHILNFAKKCVNLKAFIHVSTAYVCGEKAGVMAETPFKMGETLNGTSGLDINFEFKVMEEKLKQLKEEEKLSEAAISAAMKDFGNKRARRFGWPNTYVFTKAMGEMLIGEARGNMPLVILRPTIVTSTIKEPFPGWIEGVRTIDSLAIAYGKGRMECFLGDPNSTIDLIPADMVVNSIIVAIAAHASRPGEIVYQVGSSNRNPLKYSSIQLWGHIYFTQNPWTGRDGKKVLVRKVKILDTMESFHSHMSLRYILPLKMLELANIVCCHYFEGLYTTAKRKIDVVMRLVELYRPYLFFKAIFDDKNTDKLRAAAKNSMDSRDVFHFQFDPLTINWEDYMMNVHLPGAVKHLFK